MKEYSVLFEKYSLFRKEVETLYDFFTANNEEDAAAMCRWKHGENISVIEVVDF